MVGKKIHLLSKYKISTLDDSNLIKELHTSKIVGYNSDVNGSYNIMRKVIPDVRWDRGCAVHPKSVNI